VRFFNRQLEHTQHAISTREQMLGIESSTPTSGAIFEGNGSVGDRLDLISSGRYALEAENRRRCHVQDLTDEEPLPSSARSGMAWNSLLPTT